MANTGKLDQLHQTKSTTGISRRALVTLLGGTAAWPLAAGAQVYPSRPITMIVPFAAGGPTDTIGRIMAEGLRASLGQPVIIENVVGGSGNIAAGRVARAAGDGYTISLGTWPTHVANGALFTLQYDLLKDFEPISLIVDNPLLIVAKKTMPAQNLKELVAWLKANPDKASNGTAGPGSSSHIAAIVFQKETGTRFQYIPYNGNGPAMLNLVAGQIDLMFDLAANAVPQMRANTIKAYAVTAKSRSAMAPDVPTVDEAGLPGFYISVWHALFAPKETPNNIITKLNAAVVNALADPAVRQRLTDIGQEIFPRAQQTPEALGAYQRAEIEKWWPIIKAANLKAN